MHLSKEQASRFFRMYDALLTYVNDELKVTDDLFEHDTMFMDPQESFEVAEALWENRHLIDSFVSENPYSLDEYDLAIVLSWKLAISDMFVAMDHTAAFSVLTTDEFAFAVKGISHGIEKNIPHVPALVKTALIPFEDSIIYAREMMQMPASFGEGAREMFDEWYESALSKHSLITTVPDFAAAFFECQEIGAMRALDDLIEELEEESSIQEGEEKHFPGIHVGVLAEKSEEERERLVIAGMDDMVSRVEDVYKESLLSHAFKRKPLFSVKELLGMNTKKELLNVAAGLTEKGLSKLKKDDLIAFLADDLSQSPGVLAEYLTFCSQAEYELFKMLSENGGSVSMQVGQLGANDFSFPRPPFTYAFLDEGTITFLVPRELVELYSSLDFGRIDTLRLELKTIARYASVYTETCGIVLVKDLFALMPEPFPQEYEYGEFVVALLTLYRVQDSPFGFWSDGDLLYLINYRLTDELGYYDDDDGAADEDYAEETEGYLHYLLERHAEIPLKVLDQETVESYDVFEEALRSPYGRNLREFLDRHVPDSQNDLFFAESVIESIYEMARSECEAADYLDYYEASGLDFDSDIDMMNRLLLLTTTMINSLPQWANNGWSPIELVEQQTGKKMLFNPGGSLMKVGRNEPGPCGSGKKYKHCCG